MFRGYHVTVYPAVASAQTARRVAARVVATLGRPAVVESVVPFPDDPGTYRVDIFVPLRVSSPSRAVFTALLSVQAVASTWTVHGPETTTDGTIYLFAQVHAPHVGMRSIRRAYLELESAVPSPRGRSASSARKTATAHPAPAVGPNPGMQRTRYARR